MGFGLERANDDESGPGIRSSTWVIVSANTTFFKIEHVQKSITDWNEKDKAPLLWRDDFTSLWPVFILGGEK